MSFIRSLVFATVAVAVPLTSHADKKAPPPPAEKSHEMSKADAARFVAFFNKLIDLVVATQDDCPKMASGLNSLIDANPALIADANKADAAKQELPKAERDKMDARMSKELIPAMQKKCIKDKAVEAAMKRLTSK